MTKRLFKILLLLTVSRVIWGQSPMTLFMGTIQFPHTLSTIPHVRVYCCGHKIKCESYQETKKISFSIPSLRQRTSFYLLITNSFDYELQEKNTVNHLKLPAQQPYKFYRLTLVRKTDDSVVDAQPVYGWDIVEQRLPFKNRIPDDAIIICYNPDYIETIKGGNAIELPTVAVKSNIINLVGSENTLHEQSIELLLACMDNDALHSSIKHEVRQDHKEKTTLALMV